MEPLTSELLPKAALRVLVPVLVAHLVVDFLLHPREDTSSPREARDLVWHSVLVALLSYGLVGDPRAWLLPAIVLPSHLLIDTVKARSARSDLLSLTLDQVAHLLVLVGLASAYSATPGGIRSLWETLFGAPYYQLLVLAAGVIAAVPAGRTFVGVAVDPFLQQISNSQVRGVSGTGSRGFSEGGAVIGQLERALVLLFVLVDQPTAIGFLIAAKSVFRFGELRERSNRMEAEYIIIGTMMSFIWGLSVAYLAQAAFRMVSN